MILKYNMYAIPSSVVIYWLFDSLYIISEIFNSVSGVSIASQYPPGGSTLFQFNNLAIDVGTGNLYAGALNRLIQLDENLTSLMDITTGPVPDDPTCYWLIGQDPCYDLIGNPTSLKPTDNYNKVLVVDSKHQQLVVCGSVYQGSCETRDLRNLTSVSPYVGTLVASNSPSYSTVAFTGPGPYGDDVLYVGNYIPGISNSAWNPYNIDGVSSRSLIGNKFQLSSKYTSASPYYGTYAFLTATAALIYNINYIAGFSIQGFSYLFTQQPESYTVGPPPSVSPQVISKIVQVCQNDKNYDSYVEMQIQCKSNGVDYNLVHAATFVHPGSNLASALNISTDDYVLIGVFANTLSSQVSSALCMFKLGDIRDKFTQNINACKRNSSLQVGSQFYGSSRSCQPNSAVVDKSFCGSTPFYPTNRNSPLVGVIPLISSLQSLILNNPPVNVTAIATTNEENHTVLFMGTSNGSLIKILLDDVSGSIYSTVHLASSSLPINPDLIFSPNGTHLYVMTSKTIYKVPTSECDPYASCSSCLTAKDPYCGWCTLLNSCRRRSLCPTANIENNWIPPYYSNDVFGCPNISDISPSAADVTSESKIILTVFQMPQISSRDFFVCVFGSESYTTQANITYDQLVCQLPRPTPTVSQAIGSLSIDLSLQSSWYRTTFLQTYFTFYNCSSYSNCKSCTSSAWKCQWCIESSLCQTNSSLCDTSSNARLGDSNSCPRILTGVNNLLVSEASTVITLSVHNLPNSTQYFCGLSRGLQNIHLIPASKSADNSSVTCDTFKYSSLPYGTQSWNISVMWGPSKYLLDGAYVVTVYDCQTMSSGDCSKCRSFVNGPSAIYNCSWCDNGCQTPQNCHTQVSVCPKANITSIGPLVGPLEGGTRLTISGSNIGMSDNQIQIYIGSKICVFNDYTVANRYVCVVPPVVSPISCKNCPINITIANGVTQNDFTFYYTNATLQSISPSFGPIAGGTHITIHGDDLSIGEGTVLSASLGNQTCDIGRIECNLTQLVCVSPSVANITMIDRLTLTMDGASRVLFTTFNYVENPILDAPSTPISAYRSGGCVLTASGQKLNVSQSARVQFTSGNDTLSTVMPFQRNSSQIYFLSPKIPADSTTVNMTFILDGFRFNSFVNIIPDPEIIPFESYKFRMTGSILTIKVKGLLGRNFCTEVKIWIGSLNCPVIPGNDGSNDQILCTIPNITITSSSVNVTVGWLNVYIGDLEIPTSMIDPVTSTINPVTIWEIVGIGGGAVLIILIIIIALACKYSKVKKDCKKLESTLNELQTSEDSVSGMNRSSRYEGINPNAASNDYTDLNGNTYDELPDDNYYSIKFRNSGSEPGITSSNEDTSEMSTQTKEGTYIMYDEVVKGGSVYSLDLGGPSEGASGIQSGTDHCDTLTPSYLILHGSQGSIYPTTETSTCDTDH